MINIFQNDAFSFKSVLNQRAENKLLQTTQRLAAELDILRNRDVGLALEKVTGSSQSPSETVLNTQQDFISKAIKDIIDIRKSLGITQAAGANRPLEELFQIDKGGVVDKEL